MPSTFTSTSSSPSPSNDDVCAVCIDSLASKRVVTLHPCKHSFHRTCILQWFESGECSMPSDFKCCLCRTETDEAFDEKDKIVPRFFPFELKESPDFIEELEDYEGHLSKVCSEIFKTVGVLCEEKRQAEKNKKNEEFITDLEKEINKLETRADAIVKEFAAIVLEDNAEFIRLHEEKERLENEFEKIYNDDNNTDVARSLEISNRLEDELVAVERKILALEETTGNIFIDRCYEMANDASPISEIESEEEPADSSDSTIRTATKRRMTSEDDEALPSKRSRN